MALSLDVRRRGISIAAGGYHSLALTGTGTVAAWGNNTYGQAQPPPGLSNVLAIAAGSFHSLALLPGGAVSGWGNNYYGQLSFGPPVNGTTAIAVGGYHSLTLASPVQTGVPGFIPRPT